MRPGKGCFLVALTIPVKKVRPGAVLPRRATAGSAGMDLCACLDAPVTIAPGERAVIPTGLAFAIPDPGCAIFLYARSGLGIKHGLTLSNGVGVIDSDYRGEVCVGLCNLGAEPYTIQPGERVAQMIAAPVFAAQLTETDTLDDTDRGAGGFGSTGRLA